MENEHQVPIWFFVGCLLLVYGIIICGAGIYAWVYPPPPDARVALFELHADVWWGALLTVLGAFYCYHFNPRRHHSLT
jgi:hypothetical protein